jgi:hypothetical protein
MKKTPRQLTRKGDDETMNRKSTRTFIASMLAALLLSAVLAGAASAAPAWKFNGEELKGSETIVGAALDSSLTIPGLTTKCANFLYTVTVENVSGTGKGSVTELPLYNCTTDTAACTVKTITPETFPWAAKLITVAPSNYIVIETVKVAIVYAGPECALGGLTVKVTGTAGGKVDNTAETATFDSASFAATKTELKALSQKILWQGVFPTEAFQWHREQALTIS